MTRQRRPPSKRRMNVPQGCIYADSSSRGVGRPRTERWCAELVFLGVRLRKRSSDADALRRWLLVVNALMRSEFAADYDCAPTRELIERFEELKPRLLAMAC